MYYKLSIQTLLDADDPTHLINSSRGSGSADWLRPPVPPSAHHGAHGFGRIATKPCVAVGVWAGTEDIEASQPFPFKIDVHTTVMCQLAKAKRIKVPARGTFSCLVGADAPNRVVLDVSSLRD